MSVSGYKCTALTGGGAGALDAVAAAGLGDGDLAIVMASGLLYHYELDADSGLSEVSPDVIRPDDEAGDKRWILQRVPQTNTVPAGVVVPYLRGYFSSAANAGYASSYNTAAAVNALLNGDGWYVCDGAALSLGGSPADMFNGSNRYLPNLTDARFICGYGVGGVLGGSNLSNHYHAVAIPGYTTGSTALDITQIPAHVHHAAAYSGSTGSAQYKFDVAAASTPINTGSAGGIGGVTQGHTHTANPPEGVTGSASFTDNRPAFLTCLYIIKVLA